jgi:predicted metal-dependent hydrolase
MKPEPTRHRYDDGEHRFEYTLTLKPRMRHRYIRIRNGTAHVTAPIGTPRHTIEAFVADKAAWIARHLHRHTPVDLTRPDTVLYWRGERYPIRIERGTPQRFRFENNQAIFTLDAPPSHDAMLPLVHHHYKQHAPTILLPRIEHWARIMQLHPTRVSFRRARTRWGSCSSRNALSLNTRLLMLPDRLIDYVIVHELSHIRHKNHSRAFWDLVARYQPDYKRLRRAIRPYEDFLV